MSTQTLHPGESFGPYRIGPILGRGGMATVYCAEQTALGRRVALKVLTAELAGDERFRVRFRQEGRHIAQLEHRNILAVTLAKSTGACTLRRRCWRGVRLPISCTPVHGWRFRKRCGC